MKYLIILGIMWIGLTGAIHAQQVDDCTVLAQSAYEQLNDARAAIDVGNTDRAVTIINSAQETLVGCDIDIQNGSESSEVTSGESLATPLSEEKIDQESQDIDTSATSYTIHPADVDDSKSITFLRFANLSPDVGTLDYYFAGQDNPIVTTLAFGDVTELTVLNAGNLGVIARPSGSGVDGEQVGRLDWNFQGNSSWMVAAIGLQSEFAFFIEPISIIRNNYDDQARVRVMNFITSKERATVTTDSNIQLANGIGWVGNADSMVAPDLYNLTLTLDDGTVFENIITSEFSINKTYFVLLIGMNTEQQPIKAIMIEDRENTTRVKFVSQRSNAIDVFAMPQATELVNEMQPDAETEWIELPSGAITFILFEPDTGPTGQEIAGISRQLRPGRDVTILINDNGLAIQGEIVTP